MGAKNLVDYQSWLRNLARAPDRRRQQICVATETYIGLAPSLLSCLTELSHSSWLIQVHSGKKSGRFGHVVWQLSAHDAAPASSWLARIFHHLIVLRRQLLLVWKKTKGRVVKVQVTDRIYILIVNFNGRDARDTRDMRDIVPLLSLFLNPGWAGRDGTQGLVIDPVSRLSRSQGEP